MRKPRCYIVENRKGHDLSSAAIYGDITTLYEGQTADIFMVSKHMHQLKQLLADVEQNDYLIVSGNMILAMIAFGIMLQKLGSVNVLLFDVRNMCYVPRVIAKHQL